MKITLSIILAIALLSSPVAAESKTTPKLMNIIGFKEYRLGTPVSQYDLTDYIGPIKEIVSDYSNPIYPTDACVYITYSTLTINSRKAKNAVLLFTHEGKLQGIEIVFSELGTDFPQGKGMVEFIRDFYGLLRFGYDDDLLVTMKYTADYYYYHYYPSIISDAYVEWKDSAGNSMELDWGCYVPVLRLWLKTADWSEVIFGGAESAVRELQFPSVSNPPFGPFINN